MANKTKYHKMFKDGEIDSYQLADLLDLDYTEIGAYILDNGLRQMDTEALYKMTCPHCDCKWLIPFTDNHTCGNCKKIVRVTYENV